MSISYAVFCLIRRTPISTLFPYTTLFRSCPSERAVLAMPGYMSVYSCVSPATAALRLSRVGPIGSPVAGSPHCSSHSRWPCAWPVSPSAVRSEEHTSELQSHVNLVCRLLLDTANTHIYTLSLHDALPILPFRARSLGHARVHVRVLVRFAGDGGLEVVAGRADRQPGGRVAALLEPLEVAVRMAGLAFGGEIGRAHV